MQRGIIPPPAGVTPDFSGTRTPLQKQIVVVQSAITATSAIFLGLRLYTRAFLNRNLGLDDLLICVSWLGCIAWFVIITYAFQFGFGQHLWNVTPDKVNGYLQILIGIAIIYLWTTALAKLSLLVLYHRVSVQTPMKIAIYVLAFFTLSYTLSITGVVLGPCNPNAGRVSTCFKDLNLFMAIINIVTDFLIILLPLPMLHKLQLHRKQKILVGAVFTLGSGVIIVSIVRIIYIYSFIGYADFTYYQASAAILSDVELNVGVICACMATLKPFVTRHMSTLLSFSGHAENSNTRSRGSSHLQRSKGHRTSYGLGILENGNSKPEQNKQGNGIEVSTQYEVTSERILMDSDSTERIIVPDHR